MTVFWSSPSHWKRRDFTGCGCLCRDWSCQKIVPGTSETLPCEPISSFKPLKWEQMWVEKFPKSKKTQLVLSDLNPIQGAKIICHHHHKNHHPGPWRTWISETALSKTTSFTDTGGTGSCREQCMSGTFKVTSSKLWDIFWHALHRVDPFIGRSHQVLPFFPPFFPAKTMLSHDSSTALRLQKRSFDFTNNKQTATKTSSKFHKASFKVWHFGVGVKRKSIFLLCFWFRSQNVPLKSN